MRATPLSIFGPFSQDREIKPPWLSAPRSEPGVWKRKATVKSTHYCLVLNGEFLPLDKSTAHAAVIWLKRSKTPFRIQRRRTRFDRPAVDIIIIH